VIEGGDEIGGLCILRGCMPTKALLQSAEVLHTVQRSSIFGIRASQIAPNLKQIIARKDRLIKDFADYRRGQLESRKFEFIRAKASFKDSNTLWLSTGAELRARHFVIATGSKIAPSPLTSLDEIGFLTSD